MSALKAAVQGLASVLGSPVLVLWLWLVNVMVALPVAAVMVGSIEDSVGASLVHERLRQGFDMSWYGEYQAQAKGIEATLSPSLVGAGAFFDNLEAWFNGSLFSMYPGLVGLGILYALLWALFLGGIFHRYSPGSGIFRLGEFLSQGGSFFFRFVRLAVIAGLFYYLVYRFSQWVFGRIEETTRDVTAEQTIFGYVVAAAILVVVLLSFVNMAFDYAKIITFKENRQSMLLAAAKGFGFAVSHLGRTLMLYYGLGLVGIAFLLLYYLAAPGAGQTTMLGVVAAFLVGQVYLIAKLVLRLTFYASQMDLYEQSV